MSVTPAARCTASPSRARGTRSLCSSFGWTLSDCRKGERKQPWPGRGGADTHDRVGKGLCRGRRVFLSVSSYQCSSAGGCTRSGKGFSTSLCGDYSPSGERGPAAKTRNHKTADGRADLKPLTLFGSVMILVCFCKQPDHLLTNGKITQRVALPEDYFSHLWTRHFNPGSAGQGNDPVSRS